MYKNFIARIAVVVGLCVLLLESTLIGSYEMSSIKENNANLTLGKAADKGLYSAWKYVVSHVEKNQTLALKHPVIKEKFERIYTASLKHYFEKLADEPFDTLFSAPLQSLLFTLLEDFAAQLRTSLQDNIITLNDEDKQSMFYMLDLNERILAKRVVPQEGKLEQFLNKGWVQASLCIGGTALLAAVAVAYYNSLKRSQNSTLHVETSGKDINKSDKDVKKGIAHDYNYDPSLNALQMISPQQANLQCGFYAALNAVCMLIDPKNNNLSASQDKYKGFVEEQKRNVAKKRIENFQDKEWKSFFEPHKPLVNLSHQTKISNWKNFIKSHNQPIMRALGYRYFVKKSLTNQLSQAFQTTPAITSIIESYQPRVLLTKKEVAMLTPEDADKIYLVHKKTDEEITCDTYDTWLSNFNNKFNFNFRRYAANQRELRSRSVGIEVVNHIKANLKDFKANKGVFDENQKEALISRCYTEQLSADEIEHIIMPAIRKEFADKADQILNIGDGNLLKINPEEKMRNIFIEKSDPIKKIAAYRDNKTPIAIVLNSGDGHWVAVLMTYDEQGKPLAKVADSLGGNYIKKNSRILKNIMEMFTTDDLTAKFITDTIISPIGSAKALLTPEQNRPLSSFRRVCEVIIRAMHGYQGSLNPQSYFEQNTEFFKDRFKGLEEDVYKELHKKLIEKEKISQVVLSISKESRIASDDIRNKFNDITTSRGNLFLDDMNISTSLKNDPKYVEILIDLATCSTLNDLVKLLKENPKIKGLIASDAPWRKDPHMQATLESEPNWDTK